MQDPQRVRNFPRAFKGKVKSASQRRQQQREELAGLLGFAESNACLDSRQITAALRVQNPQLWMEYAQNRWNSEGLHCGVQTSYTTLHI